MDNVVTFDSDYEAYLWLEATHPGAMERWLRKNELELDYEDRYDFEEITWETERVMKELGYVCEIEYFGFGELEWVISNPLVERIQRCWRRYMHNRKYEEFYAQVLSVPANHPSALGRLFPQGGYGFRALKREIESE